MADQENPIKKILSKEISRREFLKKTALASALGAGFLVGCSPQSQSVGGKDTPRVQDTPTALVSETQNVDIVIVGGGNSGLAAAVQAAQLGAKVVVLESQGATGGNGYGTEGIFGIGSKLAKAADVSVNPQDIIIPTIKYFENRINPLFWKDMVVASGENVDWLQENGVQFEGKVDTYAPIGVFPTFHWWKDGKGKNYLEPMTAKAQALGATILINTPGKDLIVENGKVVGITATKSDGKIIQFNCKAIILATGGYAQNKQMMEDRGWRNTVYMGFPGHNGDGLRMAFAAGAHDETPVLGGLNMFGITGVKDMRTPIGGLGTTIGASAIWVNEVGERFADETASLMEGGVNSMRTQKVSYLIFDSVILSAGEAASKGLTDAVEGFVKQNPDKNVYKADSVEQLASRVGIDPKMLAATITHYNTLCDGGKDADFGKPAEKMMALIKPPYYSVRMDYAWFTTAGGIRIDRKMQVIGNSGNAIPGLYAVGMDSCELFREVYKVYGAGSANGHNINSARVAARNAVALLK